MRKNRLVLALIILLISTFILGCINQTSTPQNKNIYKACDDATFEKNLKKMGIVFERVPMTLENGSKYRFYRFPKGLSNEDYLKAKEYPPEPKRCDNETYEKNLKSKGIMFEKYVVTSPDGKTRNGYHYPNGVSAKDNTKLRN